MSREMSVITLKYKQETFVILVSVTVVYYFVISAFYR